MATFTFKIGGEAGQGLVSVGNILLKAVAKEGWHLFAHQDYESRIRGGHNFFQVTLSDKSVDTLHSQVDLIVALDEKSITEHKEELKENGLIFYDPDLVGSKYEEEGFVEVPFVQITKDLEQPKIMANAAASAAVWALLSDDLAILVDILTSMFAEKGEDVVKGNSEVAKASFEFVKDKLSTVSSLNKPVKESERMVLKGNEALALGSLAAGVQFMSAYPMTPSTGVTEFIASQSKETFVVMEQAEDEISAINMVIGAAFTGARAMTATSGGGFALMTEALGMAGSSEIPIVVINAQRPGPSTGLPTRTEQGDLLYALGTASGDFPKAIIAPGDIEEAFYLMNHAFNLAEKYQMPVIVLSDQHLADSQQTVEPFDLGQIQIDRGLILSEEEADSDYKRYKYTDSGISPRLYPGFTEGLVVSAGDEHDEEGHLIEDSETRISMMDKRMAKMSGVEKEALSPVLFGDDEPDIVLISWGSTKGTLKETVNKLQECCEEKVQGVHLPQVYPLPKELEKILNNQAKKYVVESNYTGQLEKLLAMEFAWKPDGSVRRYDGRPLNPQYIIDKLEGVSCSE